MRSIDYSNYANDKSPTGLVYNPISWKKKDGESDSEAHKKQLHHLISRNKSLPSVKVQNFCQTCFLRLEKRVSILLKHESFSR